MEIKITACPTCKANLYPCEGRQCLIKGCPAFVTEKMSTKQVKVNPPTKPNENE